MTRISFYFAFILSLILVSCQYDRDDYLYVPDRVQGYKPVYFDTASNIRDLIYSTTPRPVKTVGKIYTYKQYLFVGEPGLGVHVFDNTDPSSPIPFAFLNIPFNYDIAIRDTVLFADTYTGLVSIGISDFPKIYVLQYIKSSSLVPGLPVEDPTQPIPGFIRNGKVYFECIDNSKGVVVGWERATLENPKCYQ